MNQSIQTPWLLYRVSPLKQGFSILPFQGLVHPRCLTPLNLHAVKGNETLCPLFYFDIETAMCKEAQGSPCGTDKENEFRTLEECRAVCGSKNSLTNALFSAEQNIELLCDE